MICAFKSCVFFYRFRLARFDMFPLGWVLSCNATSQPLNYGVLQNCDLHVGVVFSMALHKRQVVCIPAGKRVKTGSEGRRRGARDLCMPCNPRNGLTASLQHKVGYDVHHLGKLRAANACWHYGVGAGTVAKHISWQLASVAPHNGARRAARGLWLM